MTTRMRMLERLGIVAAAGVVVLAVALCEAQDDLPAPAPGDGDQTASADAQANVEVLTSGPVHEAFADPVTLQAEQAAEGLVIATAPPEPIDELPPEAMPAGENVEWIPGYWSWSDDQEDFLWVSGLWRNVPPDQRWVPGYWANADRGYRWVSGFWTAADSQNLEYLPYPPPTQEHGPNVPAPGEGYFWIPGSWVFASGEYQWRPGYWAHAHDDWCWIPQRYVWTPRGALYSPGYWDYRIPYRGTLFAPVRFANAGYFIGGRRFTPGYVINPAGLLVSLFVRPNYGHYYFGNYYGDEYYQRGYRPWYDASFGGQYHYDPLLAFYESYYDRRGIDFSGRVSQWYTFYEQNPDRRPARTWNEARQLAAVDSDTTIQLARPLEELVRGDADAETRVDFRQLTEEQRTAFAQASTDIRDLVRNRGRIEVGDDAATQPAPDREGRQPQPGREDRPDEGAGRDPGADRGRADRTGERPTDAASRGLQLPQRERRARQILGEGPDQPDNRQTPAEAPDRDRAERDQPQRDRTERPDAERTGEPSPQRRGRIGPPAQPPQRPEQPDQPSAEDRRAPGTTRPDRGDRPGAAQPGQPQETDRRPTRNIFQPRRGNFPDASQGLNRGQRPQIDPHDAVPQFRGRGNAPQNPQQGQGGVQQRGRSGPPQGVNPPAGNRGPANPGNRGGGNSGNRGGGNPPNPRDN